MANIVHLKARGVRAQLREALAQHQLVRVWRAHLETGSFSGFVCGLGNEFFLLWCLGDYIGFDGYYVLRYADITDLEVPDQHQAFMLKAMALRGIEERLIEDFPLDSIDEALSAAMTHAPLVGVHVNSEGESEVCYIGRLIDLEPDGFTLQEITPNAEWLREPSWFEFQEISALSFLGPYARTLDEVGGPAPELDPDGVRH